MTTHAMKIFAALHDDAHQGWIWLQDARLPARCVVKISNPINGKSVYCEALQIDTNFLVKYNQSPRFNITDPASSLVVSDWFRAKLGGLSTQANTALIIKPSESWRGRFKACTDHPQIVVRVAAWLGAIGLILGIVGLILGVLSYV
jgi:hypothetical protein